MHLIVDSYGAFVGKTSERLVVRIKDEQPTEVPLDEIEQVMIASKGVTLSTDAIRECMERGVIINLVTTTGKPYGSIVPSNLSATIATLREQMRAYDDERGAVLARAFVTGKVRNAAAVLRYFAKHRRQSADMHAVLMEKSVEVEEILGEMESVAGDRVDTIRGTLLSIEGRAASVYWDGVQRILSPRIAFPGREHRGATDPVNSMLNYGYGILQAQVDDAIMLCGMHSFGGFLHTDRPGKPSLVLDLMDTWHWSRSGRHSRCGTGRSSTSMSRDSSDGGACGDMDLTARNPRRHQVPTNGLYVPSPLRKEATRWAWA